MLVLSVVAAFAMSAVALSVASPALADYVPGTPESLGSESATGVAVNQATGNVYVGTNNGEVLEFNSAGEPQFFSLSENVGRAYQIAIDESGGANNGDIYVAAPEPYGTVTQFSESGVATGKKLEGLGNVGSVAVDSSGNVYIAIYAEPGNVVEYNSELEDPRTVLEVGVHINQIALNNNGNLYLAENQSGLGTSEYAPESGKFNPTPIHQLSEGGPEGTQGVAVDRSTGDVFVDNVHEIQEYNEAGTALGGPFGSFPTSQSVAVNETTKTVYPNVYGQTVDVFVPGLPTLPLTVKKTGAGEGTVTSVPSRMDCGPACHEETKEFEETRPVTLTAKAETGSEFVAWTGCESNPTPAECKVTMTTAKTVEVEFKPRTPAPLTVKKAGTGEGTVTSAPPGIGCGPACHEETHVFYENETVTLTENAETGSEFVKWTGCESNPTPAECVVTMTAAKTVEAEFKARTLLPLAVKKTGTGKGTVTSAPSGIDCGPACHEETHQFYENETVTLTEKAEKLSQFVKWTAGCESNPTPSECVVTMTAAKTVEVEFKPESAKEIKAREAQEAKSKYEEEKVRIKREYEERVAREKTEKELANLNTFEVFKNCPVHAEAEITPGHFQKDNLCVYARTETGKSAGSYTVGSITVPLAKSVALQFGTALDEETGHETFIPAANGAPSLIPGKEPVPGEPIAHISVAEQEELGWSKALMAKYAEAQATSALKKVYEKIEFAGPAAISRTNLLFQEGTAVHAPVMVRGENAWLKQLGDTCTIGSEAEPIVQELKSGTSTSPLTGEVLHGSVGELNFFDEFQLVIITKSNLVDNEYAVPGATCTGPFSTEIAAAIDKEFGVPAVAGASKTQLKGALENATAEAVEAALKI